MTPEARKSFNLAMGVACLTWSVLLGAALILGFAFTPIGFIALPIPGAFAVIGLCLIVYNSNGALGPPAGR